MNAQQRRKAKRLQQTATKEAWKQICPRCKKPGLHWSRTDSAWPPHPLFQLKQEGAGFWSCADMYDENGRRKEPTPGFAGTGGLMGSLGLGISMSTVLSLAVLGKKHRLGQGIMKAKAQAEAFLAKDVCADPDMSQYSPEELHRNPIGF